MATKNQIECIERIMRLALQISIQGKYHVFSNYSGHVNSFEVHVHLASHDYSLGLPGGFVDGLASQENWIYLNHGDGQIAIIEAKLTALLETDEDGIPV